MWFMLVSRPVKSGGLVVVRRIEEVSGDGSRIIEKLWHVRN
jgi:hypothetical protein